jgi:hypothetical protein
MKKLLFILSAIMMLTSCSTEYFDNTQSNATKEVTFNVGGDFALEAITSLTRSADTNPYELWIIDYAEGELRQVIRQKLNDAAPKINLSFEKHLLYFVISNGYQPSIDHSLHTISWGKVGDTFQATSVIEVDEDTQSTFNISMKRVVAKLRVKIENEFPKTATTLKVTIPRWFYVMNYTTGRGVLDKTIQYATAINASSYDAEYYTLTETPKYYTTAYMAVTDANQETLASAKILSVELEKGKCSTYSGAFQYGNEGMESTFNFKLPEWEQGVDGMWY